MTLNFFEENLEETIKKMCENIKINDELEASFKHNISLKKFIDLLNYVKSKSIKLKSQVKKNITLDITYIYDKRSYSSYRITIIDLENINNFINNYKIYSNNIIYSKLIELINQKTKNIFIINKVKNSRNFIKLKEFNINIKLSSENYDIEQSILYDLLKLKDIESNYINFRLKQRHSIIVEDNDIYTISIDVTDVKQTNKIDYIYNTVSSYELEIDISFKKNLKNFNLKDLYKTFSIYLLELEKFLQQSSYLMKNTEYKNVLSNFNKLIYNNDNESYYDLPAMQSISIEIDHIIKLLPGNYTVTDKADGDRYLMIIFNKNVYLISNNLEIKKILENISEEYNDTILDGEYIYLSSPYNKYLYLAFDILFFKGQDIRVEELFKNRLDFLVKILNDLFNINLKIGFYPPKNEYNIDNIIKFHDENMNFHLTQLINNLKISKDFNIINGKYFMFPMAISSKNDIYKLSVLLYDKYINGLNIKCPYNLDGLVYTPINQKYVIKKSINYPILKWKPELRNSIDFYIEFEKDKNTNKIMKVYDYSYKDDIQDNMQDNMQDNNEENNDINIIANKGFYQIANLYVGSVKNKQEVPVLFQNETENYIAYIPIVDGYARDIHNNIIEDKTVVEFSYDNISKLNKYCRWIPLKTRFDKTESVMKYKRKYGNFIYTANSIWQSIIKAITYEDIKLLSNNNLYDNQIELLKSKIDIKDNDKYYQLTTNIGTGMRAFHNYIKTNMIQTYCSIKTYYDNNKIMKKKLDILDVCAGRGGDLFKFYKANINSAVCIDKVEKGLCSGSDSAIYRYNTMKKRYPDSPPIKFIVANTCMKLDYLNQYKYSNINEINIKNIKEIFGEDENSKNYKTFDVFNIQFAIHYMFENKDTFNALCYNINKYLNQDGYVLITTFDGNIVHNSFINNHIKKISSIDENNLILYDIIKKYSDKIDLNNLVGDSNLGLQIDIFNSIYSEKYIPEYIVNPKFLIEEFHKRCSLKLIDTDLFQNFYNINEDFIKNVSNFESDNIKKKNLNEIKEFYLLNNQNKDWFDYLKLNRYYIFQKNK